MAKQEGERQAMIISAINLGNHGKPADIKRVIADLTRTKQKSMTVDEAMKMAKK